MVVNTKSYDAKTYNNARPTWLTLFEDNNMPYFRQFIERKVRAQNVKEIADKLNKRYPNDINKIKTYLYNERDPKDERNILLNQWYNFKLSKYGT